MFVGKIIKKHRSAMYNVLSNSMSIDRQMSNRLIADELIKELGKVSTNTTYHVLNRKVKSATDNNLFILKRVQSGKGDIDSYIIPITQDFLITARNKCDEYDLAHQTYLLDESNCFNNKYLKEKYGKSYIPRKAFVGGEKIKIITSSSISESVDLNFISTIYKLIGADKKSKNIRTSDEMYNSFKMGLHTSRVVNILYNYIMNNYKDIVKYVSYLSDKTYDTSMILGHTYDNLEDIRFSIIKFIYRYCKNWTNKEVEVIKYLCRGLVKSAPYHDAMRPSERIYNGIQLLAFFNGNAFYASDIEICNLMNPHGNITRINSIRKWLNNYVTDEDIERSFESIINITLGKGIDVSSKKRLNKAVYDSEALRALVMTSTEWIKANISYMGTKDINAVQRLLYFEPKYIKRMWKHDIPVQMRLMLLSIGSVYNEFSELTSIQKVLDRKEDL